MLNGHSKMVTNEVKHQNATSVAKSVTVASAASSSTMPVVDQQVSPQGQASNRAQDDAMVSYVFQRPNEADFPPYTKSSRWFGPTAEEANLMDNNASPDAQELETGFKSLTLETEGFASTKKIWGNIEDKPSDDAKALFIGDPHQWGRDSTWSSAPSTNTVGNPGSGENGGISEHAVSKPIMVKRSGITYGADGTLISPRSTETGGIGMKMAEYVLNNSPSTKDNIDSRMASHSRLLHDHEKVPTNNVRKGSDKETVTGSNTVTPNGLSNGFGTAEDSIESTSKIFSRAPGVPHPIEESEEIVHKNQIVNAMMANSKPSTIEDMITLPGVVHQQPFADFTGDQLNSGTMDGLASFNANDYVSHLLPPAVTDSPILMDQYTSNMYTQQRTAPGTASAQANNQMSMLSGQQPMNLTGPQQNQNSATIGGHPNAAHNTNIFTAATAQGAQNPYFSDPFPMSHMLAATGAGPAAMAQFYGFAPWNLYPGMMPNVTSSNGQLQGQSVHPNSMPQQVRGAGNLPSSSNRPISPTNGNEINASNTQALAAMQAQAAGQTGFPPMIPLPGGPSGFYDQSSLIAAAGRGMPSAALHRMMPQMNMLQNPAAAAAAMGTGNMRMPPIHNANQSAPNQTQANPLFPSNGSNNGNGNSLYTSVTNSGLGYNNMNSGIFSNGHPNNQPLNFHNPALGPIGAGLQSGMSNNPIGGGNSPRRDSLDGRSSSAVGLGAVFPNMIGDNNMASFSRHLASNNTGKANVGLNSPFYGMGINSPGPMGLGLPGQSMTPPPMASMEGAMNGFANALTGHNNSLYMNGMRLMQNASDGKYMARNGLLNQNAAFAAAAAGLSNFNGHGMNNASGGLHFNHSNGIQPMSSQSGGNHHYGTSNNRISQRIRSVEKNVGRSTLLEDFRNSRLPNLTLRDLADHIVEFSQDQHGSRFIQQKLERASDEEKQLVFNEIISQAYQLMTDVFGNYVIQKFFEFGTPQQKQSLAQTIRGNVLNLALQMYGCRVIQKALESIPTDQQKEIVKELDGHVLKCVKDQNGNHVVQKCIECIEPVALQFIISAFQGQVLTLSTHPYGCRVIQRILEHCNPEQTACILQELHQNTEQLVQDQYGNYVVQHVLEHGRPEDKTKIILMVRGKVLTLSQHKFASNVVERCITQAMRSERVMLIDEVCNYNDNALYTMMKDQYANYVVQKMIEVADSQQRKTLLLRIRPHMNSLRRFTYGKHILAKLEKYINTGSKTTTTTGTGTSTSDTTTTTTTTATSTALTSSSSASIVDNATTFSAAVATNTDSTSTATATTDTTNTITPTTTAAAVTASSVVASNGINGGGGGGSSSVEETSSQ